VKETGKLRFNSQSGRNGGQQLGSARSAGRSAGNKSTSELSTMLSGSLQIELLRQIEGLNSTDEAAL
jgi:hypothetical protein